MEQIISALIGVSGVMVGILLSEILHFIREKSAEHEVLRKFHAYLVATYYELSTNLEFIRDLEKLEISTYSHNPKLSMKTEMHSVLRQYYDKLPQSVIVDIERAYSEMNILIFMVDTGPSGEHKKWTEL